jgi:hypothetical protein
MFEFIGSDAMNGAVKKLGEVLSGLDVTKLNEGLNAAAEKIPVLGILMKGYNAMTPEEQGIFAKNIMLAGAALAAKNGGKVSF